jgi:hypothetical protein
MQRILQVIAVLALIAPLSAQCNPQTAALRLFKNQGLNLLKPARDYILPGGLVVLAKGSAPQYMDPFDPVPDEQGTLIDFKATIMNEVQKNTTGISAAFDFVRTVIPMPFSLTFGSNTTVTLAQIDTSGRRLRTPALLKFVNTASTSGVVSQHLISGARVFVVQEIYSGTSLDLASTTKQSLNVTFADGKTVPPCGSEKSEGTSAKTSATDTTKAGAEPAAGQKPDNQGSTLAVATCRNGDFALRFSTKNAIPFAVRLAELQGTAGKIALKPGTTMTLTLGKDEVGAAQVGAEGTLDNLTRVARR